MATPDPNQIKGQIEELSRFWGSFQEEIKDQVKKLSESRKAQKNALSAFDSYFSELALLSKDIEEGRLSKTLQKEVTQDLRKAMAMVAGIMSTTPEMQKALNLSNKQIKDLGNRAKQMADLTHSVQKKTVDKLKQELIQYNLVYQQYKKNQQLKEEELKKRKELSDEMNKEYNILGRINKEVKLITTQIAVASKDIRISLGMALVSVGKRVFDLVHGFVELKENLGLSLDAASRLTEQVLVATMNWKGLGAQFIGIGLKENLEAASALVKEFGSINEATSENIHYIAEMKELYGVSEASSAKLMKNFTSITKSTDKSRKILDEFAKEITKTGLSAAVIFEDLSGNMSSFLTYTGKSTEQFQKMVIHARNIGISASTMTQSFDSLMDFESSLNKELQTSVLLGKQITMDKARELIMTNQTEDAYKEITKQLGSVGDFDKMYLTQKKAISEMLGMSVEDTAKLMKQGQEEAKLLELKTSYWGKIAFYSMKTVDWIKKNFDIIVSTASLANNLMQISKIMGLFKSKEVAQEAALNTQKEIGLALDQKSANVSKGGGGLKGIMGGATNMLIGAAAVAIIAGSLWVLGKALNEFNTVDWGSLAKAGVALVGLGAAMFGLSFISPVILVGAAAMLVASTSLLLLGIALQKIEAVNGNKVLETLSGLGAAAPGILAAAGAISVLGASMIGLGMGLALVAPLSPALNAIGNVSGGGSKSNEVVQKLDEIKTLLSNGSTIELNNDKFGRIIYKGAMENNLRYNNG